MPNSNSVSNDFRYETLFDHFDEQWKQGNRPLIEEFMVKVDANDVDRVAKELIAIDVDYRRRNKEAISPDDYSHVHPQAIKFAKDCLAENDTQFETDERTVTEKIETIGPYHLLEVIGQGGMGTVWKARQHQPIERTLAIKLIKPGLGSKEIIARFESERRALAMMDHPSIAKIHDAGTTSDDRPYFAMEWVDGLSVTEYCNKNGLNIKQRLQLFITICEAVQHAHQKGIIHRDLKPSNILVAQTDERALPKIIDFGLSKPLDDTLRDPEFESFTSFGQVLGSINYMSPEQASLETTDVDTRSDIYSLGAILYELLTGTTPLGQEAFSGKPLIKSLEIIRETDPQVPSKKLSGNHDCLPNVSKEGKPDSNALAKAVAGDLDWIVLKALSKEPNRRYASASEFAADIDRFLKVEPVAARSPSTGYLLGKFVRKNKTWVSAALVVAIAMVLGTIAAIWGMVSANAARNDAIKAQQSEEKRARAEARAKQKANKRTLLAFDAIQKYYAGINEKLMLEEPLFQQNERLQAIQQDLLKAPQDFYQQLEADLAEDDDPEAQFMLAKAYHELAMLQDNLGKQESCSDTLDRAIGILESLVTKFPSENRYLNRLIFERYFKKIKMQSTSRGREKLVEHLEQSMVYLDEILSREPDNQWFLAMRAAFAIELCFFASEESAQRHYLDITLSSATKIDTSTIEDERVYPAVAQHLRSTAIMLASPAARNVHPGSMADALVCFNKAIELFEKIEDPDHKTLINAAECLKNRAVICGRLIDRNQVILDLQRSLTLVEQAVEMRSNYVTASFIAGMTSYSLSKRYEEQSQVDQAKSYLHKSIGYFQKVRQQSPEFAAAKSMMNMATEHYGDLLLADEEFDEAISQYKFFDNTGQPNLHSVRPSVSVKIGLAYAKLGQIENAIQSIRSVSEKDSIANRVLAARVLAVCCFSVKESTDLTGEEKKNRFAEYSELAIKFLDIPERSTSPDFVSKLKQEKDWRVFDEVPEFQKLLGHSSKSID